MTRLADALDGLAEAWSDYARARSVMLRKMHAHPHLLPREVSPGAAASTAGSFWIKDSTKKYGDPHFVSPSDDGKKVKLWRSERHYGRANEQLGVFGSVAHAIEHLDGSVGRRLAEAWSDKARAAALLARRGHGHRDDTGDYAEILGKVKDARQRIAADKWGDRGDETINHKNVQIRLKHDYHWIDDKHSNDGGPGAYGRGASDEDVAQSAADTLKWRREYLADRPAGLIAPRRTDATYGHGYPGEGVPEGVQGFDAHKETWHHETYPSREEAGRAHEHFQKHGKLPKPSTKVPPRVRESALEETWSDEARAAALLARREHKSAPHAMEGPFNYRSGWSGMYDPKEGRYYDHKSDVYMPRDFDPHTGEGAHEPSKPRYEATHYPQQGLVKISDHQIGHHGFYDPEGNFKGGAITPTPELAAMAQKAAGGKAKQRDGLDLAVEQTIKNQHRARANEPARDAQLAYNPILAELHAAEKSGDKKRIKTARAAEEQARAVLHAAIKRSDVAKSKLGEALAELEESIMPFIPHREGWISTHFDPRVHPRTRIGEFRNIVAGVQKGKGHVTLPHGIMVRAGFGGKLQVTARGGTSAVFSSPDVAAAHALHLHDSAEIEKGADPEHLHSTRLDELAGARREAIVAGHIGDADHAATLQRSLRRDRSERTTSVTKSKNVRQERAGLADGAGGLADFFAEPHVSAAHLPAESRVADQVKPRIAEDGSVHTGYGVFHAKEHPGTHGIYGLHHDGKSLGMVGNAGRTRNALAAMHEEAMVRHVISTGSRKEAVLSQMLPAGGARFQHEVRDGKPVVTDRGKTWTAAFSHEHAIRQANKLNDATGSPPYHPELRVGDVGDFEHHQDEMGLRHFRATGHGALGAEGDDHDLMPYTAVRDTELEDDPPPIPHHAVPHRDWWLLNNGTVMDPNSGSVVGTHQYARR